MKLKETIAQLKVDMETMTFRQKTEHIWSNFKEIILIAGFALVLIIGYTVTLLTADQPIFSGYLLNVELSSTGNQAITQTFLDTIGGTGRQSVELLSGQFAEKAEQDQVEYNIAVTTQMSAMIGTQSLDFMITDAYAAEYFGKLGYYMDVSAFLTADELSALEGKLIYAQPEDVQEPIPVAVDLSDTAFAKRNIQSKGGVYLCLIANTSRLNICRDFYTYILDYQ